MSKRLKLSDLGSRALPIQGVAWALLALTACKSVATLNVDVGWDTEIPPSAVSLVGEVPSKLRLANCYGPFDVQLVGKKGQSLNSVVDLPMTVKVSAGGFFFHTDANCLSASVSTLTFKQGEGKKSVYLRGLIPGTYKATFAAPSFTDTAFDFEVKDQTLADYSTAERVDRIWGAVDGAGYRDGAGNQAGIYSLLQSAVVNGEIYFAEDQTTRIRKLNPATGQVTAVAGTSRFWGNVDGAPGIGTIGSPRGLAYSSVTGLVYFSQYNGKIRTIDPASRNLTTLAATCGNGTGTNYPSGMTLMGSTLYIAKADGVICEMGINPPTAATVHAGLSATVGTSFSSGLTTDGTDLYVTDYGGHSIRKINPTTWVSTVVVGSGTGGYLEGIGTAAQLNGPRGIVYSPFDSNFYFADDGLRIRKFSVAGAFTTSLVVGAGKLGSVNGVGAAARFWTVEGMTVIGSQLYFAGYENAFRKIDLVSKSVSDVAGNAAPLRSVDGSFGEARFGHPRQMTRIGNVLYIVTGASGTFCELKKFDLATGLASVLAGSEVCGTVNGTGAAAQLNTPLSIATDGTSLYFSDRWAHTVRKVDPATGQVTSLAGISGTLGTADGAFAGTATFNQPTGLTYLNGNLYTVDYGSNRVRKLDLVTNQVSTIAGQTGTNGSADGTGAAATFSLPWRMTTDGTDLFVVDVGNCRIRKVTTAGVVTTIVGSACTSALNVDSATGATALLGWSNGGITYASGALYYADEGNSRIRKIVIGGSYPVSSVVGNYLEPEDRDGVIADARFARPQDLVATPQGLYVLTFGGIRFVH